MGFLKRTLGAGWPWQQRAVIERDVQPLEGTRMSLWNSQIPDWWASNINNTFPMGGAALADRLDASAHGSSFRNGWISTSR